MNDDQIYTEWELSALRAEKPSIVYRPVLVDPDYNLDTETMNFTPAEIAERDKANVESLKRWSGK